MNRTNLLSTFISLTLLLAPAVSYAAVVSPAQPVAPADTIQSLASELTAVSASVASLASSTVPITLISGQSDNGFDTRTGGELRITNSGTYHTVSQPYSFSAPIELSKLIFQYIPCTAVSPVVCTENPAYPPITSELPLNGSTNYLNYSIQVTALSATSTSLQVTSTTEFTNIQNELNSISARLQTVLAK